MKKIMLGLTLAIGLSMSTGSVAAADGDAFGNLCKATLEMGGSALKNHPGKTITTALFVFGLGIFAIQAAGQTVLQIGVAKRLYMAIKDKISFDNSNFFARCLKQCSIVGKNIEWLFAIYSGKIGKEFLITTGGMTAFFGFLAFCAWVIPLLARIDALGNVNKELIKK